MALPSVAAPGDVTPDVIFGSGNLNGSFTIGTSAGSGTGLGNNVELGLRGKLRHNASGAPENTFNWDGTDTYNFNAGVAPTQSFPTAEWSFEWSINTDAQDSSGLDLDDLTYELSMTSNTAASITVFDPINDPVVAGTSADHALGDNSTGNGAGLSISNGSPDLALYTSRINTLNVAQNSWKPHWFATSFDPTLDGTYTFTLSAFDGSTQVASTSMDVVVGTGGTVIPSPTAFAAGLIGLGGLAMRRRRRAA